MDITLPHETEEFVEIPVWVDDVPSTDFEVCVTRWSERPANWMQASIDGDDAGILITGLTPGQWRVWVRVDGSVVVAAGTIWAE